MHTWFTLYVRLQLSLKIEQFVLLSFVCFFGGRFSRSADVALPSNGCTINKNVKIRSNLYVSFWNSMLPLTDSFYCNLQIIYLLCWSIRMALNWVSFTHILSFSLSLVGLNLITVKSKHITISIGDYRSNKYTNITYESSIRCCPNKRSEHEKNTQTLENVHSCEVGLGYKQDFQKQIK